VTIGDHSSTISYQDSGQGHAATLTCVCGWSVPLESADKPWGIVEVQRRLDEHLPEGLANDSRQSKGDSRSQRVSGES